MITGCAAEIIGYSGRVMMYYNPFRFDAFMIQIGNVLSILARVGGGREMVEVKRTTDERE